MSDDLPAGSRGGVVIHHYFPANGEYVLRIRMHRNRNGVMHGLGEPNVIDVRVDGVQVKTFTIGGRPVADPLGLTTQEPAQRYGGDNDPDAGLNVRVQIKAGSKVIGIAFHEKTWAYEGVGPSRLPVAAALRRYAATCSNRCLARADGRRCCWPTAMSASAVTRGAFCGGLANSSDTAGGVWPSSTPRSVAYTPDGCDLSRRARPVPGFGGHRSASTARPDWPTRQAWR